jgi:hypothetical protein
MEREAARAVLHARARWIGVACFLVAVLELVALVVAAARGLSPWSRVPLGLFATGISLGTFGANNDTALVYASRVVAGGGAVAEPLAAELAHEARVRPGHVAGLHASPKAAWILPLVAVTVLAWTGWRLAGAFGVAS